ncbi:MAG: hypothetical protein J6B67_00380 [Oscillospiraceae bacterium]|nr:hypothetical protein [Oscillospiraceae bacterium]
MERFLPMWAKETVLSDNRLLKRQNRKLRQDNEQLLAYIRGLETGIRAGKRITIQNGGAQA